MKPTLCGIVLIFTTCILVPTAKALEPAACDALVPRSGGDTKEETKGGFDAGLQGLVARLSGVNVDVEGVYKEEFADRVPDYDDPDTLFVLERMIYLRCQILAGSDYSDDEISREFEKLFQLANRLSSARTDDGVNIADAGCVPSATLPPDIKHRATLYYHTGRAAYDAGDLTRAIACFESAAIVKPNILHLVTRN